MTGAVRFYVPDVVGDSLAWQEEAVCASTDPDLFFPDPGDVQSSLKAREICSTCPVVAECARLGLKFEYGIFGGLTAMDRRAVKKSA